jgi:hypothetical protein
MNFKHLLQAASLGLVIAASGAAHAGGTPQNHHCKMQDGTTDAGKTKKQCLKAKGTWAKDGAAAPAAAAPAAAAPAAPAAAAPAAAPAAPAPAAAPTPKS